MYQDLFGHTILVVDDYVVTLKIVKKALENADYEVWTAMSGQEALDLIHQRGLPHLALVDLHMPGMTGFELVKCCTALVTFPLSC